MYKIALLVITILFNLNGQNRWEKLKGPVGSVVTGIISKGDTLLIGTGLFKASIYYSTNNGKNWFQSNLELKHRITDFVFTEDDAVIAAAFNNGLYKSTDLINWARIFIVNDEFWSLGKDNSGKLYAGTQKGVIYLSTDNGINWSVSTVNGHRIYNFDNNFDATLFSGTFRKILRKNNNQIWETVYNHSIDQSFRVFSSDNTIYGHSSDLIYSGNDNGNNWVQLDTNNFFLGGNFIYGMTYNHRMMAACSDETGWFGNGWGVALSDDGGYTWRWSNNTGLPPKFSAAFKFAKSGNDTFLGTNAAGVFKSTDFGESWTPINNGITSAEVLDICFDNNGNMFAACWSNGVQKSTDNGVTWEVINNGLTNSYLLSIIADDEGNLLAGTEQGIFSSTNGGEDWIRTTPAGNDFGYHLFKDGSNRLYVLNYFGGIYRTENLGNSWIRIDQNLPSSASRWGFAIDGNNNLYAGTASGSIYKSTNDGLSWTKVYQSSNQNSFLSYISISKNGYIYATNNYEGILLSTDQGSSWELVKVDQEYQTRYPIAANSKGEVFAGGAGDKLYYSNDNGNSWLDYTSNLQYTSVRNIVMDKDENIYLATNESIWKINPDSIVSVAGNTEVPTEYRLYQNYPNPFNPTTTIKYSVKETGMVSLTVYDILGKEITTLVNETKSPGEYNIVFDGSKLSSGIYFYTMQTGGFIAINKFLLVK